MKRRNFWIAFAVVAALLGLGAARLYVWLNPHGAYNTGHGGLALAGYDPVAYFPEGGGSARPGDPARTIALDGRVYRFASDENLARFRADPAHYEPQYGGWCAYAVANGYRFHVDPQSFRIEDGRLLLFYKGALGDAKAEFERADVASEVRNADSNWQTLRAD